MSDENQTVTIHDISRLASATTTSNRVDSDLFTSAVAPGLKTAVLPDGLNRPTLNRLYNIIGNVIIENEDLLIIFKPGEVHAGAVGVIYSKTQDDNYWNFVGYIAVSMDMSSVDYFRTVSADLTIWCDTISTTNTNLSGRMTTIKVYDLGTGFPEFSTLPSYIPLSSHKVVNVALAEGTHSLMRPYYRTFTKTTGMNYSLGSTTDNYPAITQDFTATIDADDDVLDVSSVTIHSMSKITPYVSGSVYFQIVGRYVLSGSSATPGRFCVLVAEFIFSSPQDTPNGQTVTNVSHFAQYNITQTVNNGNIDFNGVLEPVAGSQYNTTKLHLYSLADALTININGHLDLYCLGPGLTRNGYDVDVTIIQGSEGRKNIAVSGNVNYQIIPKPQFLQQATITEVPIATFVPLEEFNSYVADPSQSGLALVMTRSGYASWLTRMDFKDTRVLGKAAEISGFNGSVGHSGLFSHIIRTIPKVVHTTSKVLNKALPYVDKTYEALNKLGLAAESVNDVDDDEDEIDDFAQRSDRARRCIGFQSLSNLQHRIGYAMDRRSVSLSDVNPFHVDNQGISNALKVSKDDEIIEPALAVNYEFKFKGLLEHDPYEVVVNPRLIVNLPRRILYGECYFLRNNQPDSVQCGDYATFTIPLNYLTNFVDPFETQDIATNSDVYCLAIAGVWALVIKNCYRSMLQNAKVKPYNSLESHSSYVRAQSRLYAWFIFNVRSYLVKKYNSGRFDPDEFVKFSGVMNQVFYSRLSGGLFVPNFAATIPENFIEMCHNAIGTDRPVVLSNWDRFEPYRSKFLREVLHNSKIPRAYWPKIEGQVNTLRDVSVGDRLGTRIYNDRSLKKQNSADVFEKSYAKYLYGTPKVWRNKLLSLHGPAGRYYGIKDIEDVRPVALDTYTEQSDFPFNLIDSKGQVIKAPFVETPFWYKNNVFQQAKPMFWNGFEEIVGNLHMPNKDWLYEYGSNNRHFKADLENLMNNNRPIYDLDSSYWSVNYNTPRYVVDIPGRSLAELNLYHRMKDVRPRKKRGHAMERTYGDEPALDDDYQDDLKEAHQDIQRVALIDEEHPLPGFDDIETMIFKAAIMMNNGKKEVNAYDAQEKPAFAAEWNGFHGQIGDAAEREEKGFVYFERTDLPKDLIKSMMADRLAVKPTMQADIFDGRLVAIAPFVALSSTQGSVCWVTVTHKPLPSVAIDYQRLSTVEGLTSSTCYLDARQMMDEDTKRRICAFINLDAFSFLRQFEKVYISFISSFDVINGLSWFGSFANALLSDNPLKFVEFTLDGFIYGPYLGTLLPIPVAGTRMKYSVYLEARTSSKSLLNEIYEMFPLRVEAVICVDGASAKEFHELYNKYKKLSKSAQDQCTFTLSDSMALMRDNNWTFMIVGSNWVRGTTALTAANGELLNNLKKTGKIKVIARAQPDKNKPPVYRLVNKTTDELRSDESTIQMYKDSQAGQPDEEEERRKDEMAQTIVDAVLDFGEKYIPTVFPEDAVVKVSKLYRDMENNNTLKKLWRGVRGMPTAYLEMLSEDTTLIDDKIVEPVVERGVDVPYNSMKMWLQRMINLAKMNYTNNHVVRLGEMFKPNEDPAKPSAFNFQWVKKHKRKTKLEDFIPTLKESSVLAEDNAPTFSEHKQTLEPMVIERTPPTIETVPLEERGVTPKKKKSKADLKKVVPKKAKPQEQTRADVIQ